MAKDSTRLVNEVSGGISYFPGDIFDQHNYPDPVIPRPELFGAEQVVVLGENGGLGLPLIGHLWQDKDFWEYRNFKDADLLKDRHECLMNDQIRRISHGLLAAGYAQTTFVEGKVNSLLTYDWEIMKMPDFFMKNLHQKLNQ